MKPSLFEDRLRLAFLLATLTPTAACGGATQASTDGDAGKVPSDSAAPTDSGNEASTTPDDGSTHSDASCTHAGPPPSLPLCSSAWPPCDYDGGALSDPECEAICPHDSGMTGIGCYATTSPDGVSVIACTCSHMGRRTEGLDTPPPSGATPGQFLARCAWLEAASVHAFRHLADELSAHGAPRELVAKARAAAREEVRHAAMMSRLARRFGCESIRPEPPGVRIRDLAAIAAENAVEGCVREAYGALVAMWMAGNTADDDVRRVHRSIAREESGHAALAWEIAAWLEPLLDANTRSTVDRARRTALAELRAELEQEPSRSIQERLGVPSSRDARRLFDGFVRTIFASEADAA
jgi:hypothetical protein